MSDDPREAVIAWLSPPPSPTGTQGGQNNAVAEAGWVRGAVPEPADTQTIVFHKECAGVTQRIYAVSYFDTGGRPHFDVVGVSQQADGSWSGGGLAGGSGNGPVRDKPWVNLGGWWGADLFCAGGRVIGAGAEQARRVQLRFADETTVEDTVDDGVVLYLVEHGVELPAEADIFSADGTLIATQRFP